MREIKFRVWCDVDKRWKHPVYCITNPFPVNTNKSYHFEQYTGLKDKNGVDIYEGDIIRFIDSYFTSTESGQDWEEFINKGVVAWGSDYWGWIVTCRESIDRDDLIDNAPEFEIIGNIHQNPELITPQDLHQKDAHGNGQ